MRILMQWPLHVISDAGTTGWVHCAALLNNSRNWLGKKTGRSPVIPTLWFTTEWRAQQGGDHESFGCLSGVSWKTAWYSDPIFCSCTFGTPGVTTAYFSKWRTIWLLRLFIVSSWCQWFVVAKHIFEAIAWLMLYCLHRDLRGTGNYDAVWWTTGWALCEVLCL